MNQVVRINWDNEFIHYILDGHAAFRKHLEIATEFMVEFKEELEPLQETLGHDILYNRVYEKVKLLSPNGARFPEQFRPEFDRLRIKWTDKAKEIKGYHRTARLQTLQELLEETMAEPLSERYTQSNKVAAVTKIISEMRAEGDKSQILISDDVPKVESSQDKMQDMIKLMTPDQIKEIQDAGANNQPIRPIFERIVRDIRLAGDGKSDVPRGTASTDGTEPGDDETAGGTPTE